MSEFKVGDRVKVASFEGVINYIGNTVVDVEYGDDSYAVPASLCTKIVQPLKVGDVITGDDIARLPIEGVVRPSTRARGLDRPVTRTGSDGWQRTGQLGYIKTADVRTYGDLTIIYLP